MTAETDRQQPSLAFLVLALGGISYSLLQSLVAPALARHPARAPDDRELR
jgi:hypothetical protein